VPDRASDDYAGMGPLVDQWSKEWAECRTTIGRLDTILVDLRKVGFSFITALLTAGSFLSVLGPAAAAAAEARAVAFGAIMTLITALFFVDCYYENLMAGAVERGLDLESRTKPPVRLTTYLTQNALASHATRAVLALYLGLIVVAAALGAVSVLSNVVQSNTTPAVTSVQFEWTGWALVPMLAGVLFLAGMTVYWSFCAYTLRLYQLKRRPGQRTET
jgi:hypothetical protein